MGPHLFVVDLLSLDGFEPSKATSRSSRPCALGEPQPPPWRTASSWPSSSPSPAERMPQRSRLPETRGRARRQEPRSLRRAEPCQPPRELRTPRSPCASQGGDALRVAIRAPAPQLRGRWPRLRGSHSQARPQVIRTLSCPRLAPLSATFWVPWPDFVRCRGSSSASRSSAWSPPCSPSRGVLNQSGAPSMRER